MSDQCTGPFSDAKDCPVHSKDVKGRTYTESELAAERAALLREAAIAVDSCLKHPDYTRERKEGDGTTVTPLTVDVAEVLNTLRHIPTDQSALARVEAAAVAKAFSKVQFQFNYWLHQGYDPLTAIQMSCDLYMDTLQDRGREADAGERWEEADTKKALDVIDRDFKR